jgi:cyanophycinase
MLTALLALTLAADPTPAPKGHLVVVGGGSTTPPITRRTLELAGGPSARVLIVPQASASANAGEASATMWRELGAKEVNVLSLADADAAVRAVQSADLIWMPGGDQNRLMEALAKTRVPEAIRERYRQGATVGGTSAGAAVMSPVMLTGEADLERVKHGATVTREALGLWPGVIVDQHFVRRERLHRLLAAVLDRPHLVGVGIDENTAAVVSGTRFEVIGGGQVIVFDARKAKVPPGQKGEFAAATGVTLHVLKPGMTFDLNGEPGASATGGRP